MSFLTSTTDPTLPPDGEDISQIDVISPSLKIIQSLIIVIGCAMNIAFIIVIFKGKKMRNTVNTYLLNLAIADTIYLVVNMFLTFTQNGNVITLLSLLSFLSMYTSLLIVTAVSVERYYAVCKQRVYRAGNRRQRTLIISASSWIISFVLVIGLVPKFYQRFQQNFETFSRVFQLFICVVYFGLFAVCFTSYTRIVYKLKFQAVPINNSTTSRGKTTAREAAARMIVVNGVFFFMLTAPAFSAVPLGYIYGTNAMFQTALPKVIVTFLLLNAAANFFIYLFCNANYRAAFKEAFCHRDNNKDCIATEEYQLNLRQSKCLATKSHMSNADTCSP